MNTYISHLTPLSISEMRHVKLLVLTSHCLFPNIYRQFISESTEHKATLQVTTV